MKKILFTCFLGGLCLMGSDLNASSKVVFSPWADISYKSAPYDSGSFSHYPFSGGVSLVDTSGSLGQDGIRSSAPFGALIYGELINPDSLGPLRIVFSPFKKDLGQSLPDSTLEIRTTHGTFFDGVLDPRVRKFRIQLPEFSDHAYFSLYLDDRPLIEEFMVNPMDSMMVGIDLKRSILVFAGPEGDFLETQYLIARAKEQARFSAPRNLVEGNREAFMATEDYRSKLEAANREFGARLRILELTKDHLDLEIDKLTMDVGETPGWHVLESRKRLLTDSQYAALKEDLLGSHYATSISSVRRYGYVQAKAQHNIQAVEKIEKLMPGILSELRGRMEQIGADDLTGGGAFFYKEWAKMGVELKNQDFADLVVRELEGNTRDVLLYTHAIEQVARREDPVKFLAEVTALMSQGAYREELEAMEARLSPNVPIRPAGFLNGHGERVDIETLKGKPVLLYFYFSTCTHSANFFQRVLKPIYGSGYGNMQIVAVSVDNDPDLWKSQLSTYSDPRLTNLRLPSKSWRGWLDHYLIAGYPRTMLLDAEGNILSIWVRGRTEAAFRTSLASLLGPEESNLSNPTPQP